MSQLNLDYSESLISPRLIILPISVTVPMSSSYFVKLMNLATIPFHRDHMKCFCT